MQHVYFIIIIITSSNRAERDCGLYRSPVHPSAVSHAPGQTDGSDKFTDALLNIDYYYAVDNAR